MDSSCLYKATGKLFLARDGQVNFLGQGWTGKLLKKNKFLNRVVLRKNKSKKVYRGKLYARDVYNYWVKLFFQPGRLSIVTRNAEKVYLSIGEGPGSSGQSKIHAGFGKLLG